MKAQSMLRWSSIEVEVKRIEPTPKNYKIQSDLGKQRLSKSLELFGLAGNVVCNCNMKLPEKKRRYPLIDGNSRVEQAKARGERTIWVSVPSRELSAKEYKEMSAMYDYAKAGEVDEERIKGDLGKTEDFFNRWGWAVPQDFLDKLGANAKVERGKKAAKKDAAVEVLKAEEQVTVTLFLTLPEEKAFRLYEQRISSVYKTSGTTATVLRAMKIVTSKK